MSRALPKEPEVGDIHLGRITHYFAPWLWVDIGITTLLHNSELTAYLTPESVLGRRVEVEIVQVEQKRRAVVIRLRAFLD